MGIVTSKDLMNRKRVDEATSNSSLSNLQFILVEKPKWKVFKKKEVVAVPQNVPLKGCPCGNDVPCKQKVTPRGVTLHYPRKKKKLGTFGRNKRFKSPKVQKSGFYSQKPVHKAKVSRNKKLTTWRLDKISLDRTFGAAQFRYELNK